MQLRFASILYSLTLALTLASMLALLAGCGSTPATTVEPRASLSGVMHGGQQPLADASVQLYAMGSTGDGSASTPLLNTPVFTDANGGFTLTNAFTCPSPTAQVYLVGTGGNPGLAAGTNNGSIALMAALGQCSTLTSTRNISVNELTTIGSVIALAPYIGSYSAIGSGSGDANALTAAVALVTEYTDTASGAVPGPSLPSGYYASSVQINTLGNVVAACINSFGGTAGDGSLCGQLFSLTQPGSGTAPTDTIAAILQIVDNPTHNAAALYNLVGSIPPFQPQVAAAPAAWTFPILPLAATPVISPAGGSFTSAQSVTLSDTTSGSTIYYTVDGTTPTTASPVYSVALTVSASETIKAIATAGSFATSSVASASFTISQAAAAPPSFNVLPYSPSLGGYQVQANIPSNFGSIAYTIDGSTPTTANCCWSGSAYYPSGYTTILAKKDDSTVLKAFVTGTSGLLNSPIISIPLPMPASQPPYFQLPPGTYSTITNSTNQFVIKPATGYESVPIYYTTDGSTPTTSSLLYPAGNSLVIQGTVTIQAIASGAGWNDSSAISGTWTATTGPLTTPVISTTTAYPTGGIYTQPVTVTIAASTGPKVYYTVDGTTPTTSSALYTGPFLIGTTTTIKAIAVATGFANSAVGSGTFTVTLPTPMFYPGGGTYSSAQQVGMGGSFPYLGNFYYTTDGTIPTAASARYVGSTVAVSSTETLKLVYISTAGGVPSPVATATYTFVAPAPTFSYAAGAYTAPISVALADTASGAVIYYTTDGTTPTTGSPVYSVPIPVSTGTTIQAFAVAGSLTSPVTSAAYNFTVPAPTFSMPTGTYSPTLSVALGDTFPGASIYYTTDGTAPTTSSTLYTGPLAVSATTHVNAIAASAGATTSATASAIYTINTVTATPVISPAGGTFTAAQAVTIADASSGAVIYYTTDNSTPTTASPIYAAALNLSASQTVKAMAVAPSLSASAVASAVFSINIPQPPTILPGSGTYSSAQTVTITGTSGWTIYYTTDGSAPTTSSMQYTGSITVSANETIHAIIAKSGSGSSAAATAVYVFAVASPVFSQPSGLYPLPLALTLSTPTPGASIYYTTDGTPPTTSSQLYSGGITVSTMPATINAIAVLSGLANSPLSSATYTQATAATPTEAQVNPQSPYLQVAVSSTTPGAVIYYNYTSAFYPSSTYSLYTGPIAVTNSGTISAYATAPGYKNSATYSSQWVSNNPF